MIKIPLAHPENSAIVSSPRVFNDLPVAPRNPERDAAGARGNPAPGAGNIALGGLVVDATNNPVTGANVVIKNTTTNASTTVTTTAAGVYSVPTLDPGVYTITISRPSFKTTVINDVQVVPQAAGGQPVNLRTALEPGAATEIVTVAGGGGRGGRGGAGGRAGGPPTGPNQCHDITVYPDVGLAGGACGGLGLLLDIREAAHPIRIDFAADANMSFWHSATFSNDGKKVLFSDEWGGGSAPRCRATDKLEWGGDAIFTIENNKLKMHSYYKMPAAQTDFENCVAHNGSLIPIPGRDIMVQAFYQGGLTVFDWTDPDHVKEIAFFDRGPVAADRLVSGGSWSAYWYNGVIVSSEIARGLDVYELIPNPNLTQNEIDAAKTVKMDYWNTQEQRKFTWPPSFALVKAYLDQLQRNGGYDAAKITAARSAVASAESASGAQRRTALQSLATTLNSDAGSAKDAAKVRTLAAAVTALAGQ